MRFARLRKNNYVIDFRAHNEDDVSKQVNYDIVNY